MKVIIAPDKFKGSLNSFEVCAAIAAGIRQVDSKAEILSFPMADGGDGFAAVMKHYLQTTTLLRPTVDPLGRFIQVSYEWNEAGKTAIIELASASGLVLLQRQDRNPLNTSTYGTGLLIKDAIAMGAKKIILGLGGSATNDAGLGILAAMGFHIKHNGGSPYELSRGEELSRVVAIVPPASLAPVDFLIACDVQNPLYGLQGAAYVYAPQKGASPEEVEELDKGLRHYAGIIQRQTGKDIASMPGTGAAGGIAASLIPFFNARLTGGTEMIINASGVKNALAGADLIITGEGKLDEQTKQGKPPFHIALLAKEKNIPVIGLCGSLALDKAGIEELGLNDAAAIMDVSLSLEENMAQGARLLTKRTAEVLHSPEASEWKATHV